jgi:hypothetical protein
MPNQFILIIRRVFEVLCTHGKISELSPWCDPFESFHVFGEMVSYPSKIRMLVTQEVDAYDEEVNM